MMLIECCNQYSSRFGILSNGQSTGKYVFIPISKKCNAKECSIYHSIVFISHSSKIVIWIFQARLQQYMNWELPDVQARYRRGRGTRNLSKCWIIEKARKFPQDIYFCFIDYAKAFDYVGHIKLWKILKETGIPDHFACLLRRLKKKKKKTESDKEHWAVSKSGKEWVKAVYCHLLI